MSKRLKESLVFMPPIVGPKVYLARGSSLWPETFDRTKADAELAAFLNPLDVNEVLDTFLLGRDVSDDTKPVTWHTIVGFLGRTMSVHPNHVPQAGAIAFWAHVIMADAHKHSN